MEHKIFMLKAVKLLTLNTRIGAYKNLSITCKGSIYVCANGVQSLTKQHINNHHIKKKKIGAFHHYKLLTVQQDLPNPISTLHQHFKSLHTNLTIKPATILSCWILILQPIINTEVYLIINDSIYVLPICKNCKDCAREPQTKWSPQRQSMQSLAKTWTNSS